jgi:hypothetical protein
LVACFTSTGELHACVCAPYGLLAGFLLGVATELVLAVAGG